MHAHTSVALWSALEAYVEDVVVAVLRNDPSSHRIPEVARIKVPLADFEEWTHEDRAKFLAAELKQSSKAELKVGAGALESTLDVLDFGGAIPDEDRRTILELQQVRHVLVHRAALADSRLLETCPWLNYKKGERIRVSSEMYLKYFHASLDYAVRVRSRLRTRYRSASEPKTGPAHEPDTR